MFGSLAAAFPAHKLDEGFTVQGSGMCLGGT
jgi:hypothetical protein